MAKIDDVFEKSVNPHDAAFKSAFQKKRLAAGFFRRCFPKNVVRHIDFRSLRIGDRSYVDEKLKDRHSDIVYQAKIRGGIGFLYILFEHQSKPDHWMIFRLLSYMVNIWKEFLDQNPGTKRLPVIFPAVLYNGKSGWHAPMCLKDLMPDGGDFLAYIPNFTYELYNLGEFEDEKLTFGDHMALAVVLYLMKHIFDKDFGAVLEHAMTIHSKIRDEKTSLEFLEWLLRYTFHARDEDPKILIGHVDRGIEKTGNANARRIAMTAAEKLRQQGLEEGLATGRSAIILRMIKKRFGHVPPVIEQALRKSNPEIMDRFGESIFDFRNLDDAEKWWEKVQ